MKKHLLLPLVLISTIFTYAQTNHTLNSLTYGSPAVNQFNEIGYYIDGAVAEYDGCGIVPSIMIALIDSCTCELLSDCNLDYGQVNQFTSSDCTLQNTTLWSCRPRPSFHFQFALNDPNAIDGMNDLLNSATSCNYILAYTWLTYPYSTLSPAFKNGFINLGATAINTLPDNAPYIFFCKKGDLTSVQEVVGFNATDTLTLNTSYNCATTGVSGIDLQEMIDVYPNPATSGFLIKNLQAEKDVQLNISDQVGQIVYTEILSGKKEHLINAGLSSGIYFINVKIDSKVLTRKIVVL